MDRQLERRILQVLEAKAVDIRNVDGGEEPFLYSSGWHGPGYVMMKGLVAREDILVPLVNDLAVQVAKRAPQVQFVAGNVSGGVIPGWILRDNLTTLLSQRIQYVYVRETRKKGGQKELVTGLAHIPPHSNGLIVEELVNFAETTSNSAEVVRSAGHTVTHAACILFYNNPESLKALHVRGIEMIYLFTLPELLDVAEQCGVFTHKAILGYREFLDNPIGWNEQRGYARVESGGTK